MKKVLISLILIIIILNIFSHRASETTPNQIANLNNGGYVAIQGNWIFYSNPDDANKLYKSKLNGSKKTKLTDNMAYQINLSGEWIYYIGQDQNICRVKTDGTHNEVLLREKSTYLYVKDNWIFYSSLVYKQGLSHDLYFYRISSDKRYKTKLDKVTIGFYMGIAGFDENYIYYYIHKDFYRMKQDGTENLKLFSGDLMASALVRDGWIYYTNGYSLKKVLLNGEKVVTLCDDKPLSINIQEEYLYYHNRLDNGKLYRIKTDGTNKRKLCDDFVRGISIIGDWIYYKVTLPTTDGTIKHKLLRIKTDGTKRSYID